MSIKQTAGGKSDINFASSAGGLVSALAGSGLESFWIGWPGGEVKSREDRSVVIDKLKALKSIPVFLSAEVCDLFYNGFCNDLLWPLFHYIPLPISAIKQHDKQFAAYQKANAEFAKVTADTHSAHSHTLAEATDEEHDDAPSGQAASVVAPGSAPPLCWIRAAPTARCCDRAALCNSAVRQCRCMVAAVLMRRAVLCCGCVLSRRIACVCVCVCVRWCWTSTRTAT